MSKAMLEQYGSVTAPEPDGEGSGDEGGEGSGDEGGEGNGDEE